MNAGWLELILIAHDLTSWSQTRLLRGELAACEPSGCAIASCTSPPGLRSLIREAAHPGELALGPRARPPEGAANAFPLSPVALREAATPDQRDPAAPVDFSPTGCPSTQPEAPATLISGPHTTCGATPHVPTCPLTSEGLQQDRLAIQDPRARSFAWSPRRAGMCRLAIGDARGTASISTHDEDLRAILMGILVLGEREEFVCGPPRGIRFGGLGSRDSADTCPIALRNVDFTVREAFIEARFAIVITSAHERDATTIRRPSRREGFPDQQSRLTLTRIDNIQVCDELAFAIEDKPTIPRTGAGKCKRRPVG